MGLPTDAPENYSSRNPVRGNGSIPIARNLHGKDARSSPTTVPDASVDSVGFRPGGAGGQALTSTTDAGAVPCATATETTLRSAARMRCVKESSPVVIDAWTLAAWIGTRADGVLCSGAVGAMGKFHIGSIDRERKFFGIYCSTN
jgi:hypothetical protein